jgi:hypothetical protein
VIVRSGSTSGARRAALHRARAAGLRIWAGRSRRRSCTSRAMAGPPVPETPGAHAASFFASTDFRRKLACHANHMSEAWSIPRPGRRWSIVRLPSRQEAGLSSSWPCGSPGIPRQLKQGLRPRCTAEQTASVGQEASRLPHPRGPDPQESPTAECSGLRASLAQRLSRPSRSRETLEGAIPVRGAVRRACRRGLPTSG